MKIVKFNESLTDETSEYIKKVLDNVEYHLIAIKNPNEDYKDGNIYRILSGTLDECLNRYKQEFKYDNYKYYDYYTIQKITYENLPELLTAEKYNL